MSDSSTSSSKERKPHTFTHLDWDSCLFHCCDVNGALTSFTAVSWARLGEVACLRKDATWSFVKGRLNEGPRGFYHQECYKAYTRPSSLRQLQRKSGSHSTSIVGARQKLAASVAASTSSGSSIFVADEGLNVASTAPRRSKRFTSTTDKRSVHNLPAA